MIVYNVTVKVENSIEHEWLDWIAAHATEVVATGCFVEYSFFELLEPKVDDQRTFVIQYFAKTMEDYERYLTDFAPQLKEDGIKKFGEKFVAFRSILEKLA
jgi:hypothetical protein